MAYRRTIEFTVPVVSIVPDYYHRDNEPCQEGPRETECVCANWHYFCITIALHLHTGWVLSGRALVAESRGPGLTPGSATCLSFTLAFRRSIGITGLDCVSNWP